MSSENSFPFKFKDIQEQNFESKSLFKNGEENISSRESNNLEININDNIDINKIKELNSKSVDLILEEKTEKALEILKNNYKFSLKNN
jgi:murein L,D-transpeptidase YafK